MKDKNESPSNHATNHATPKMAVALQYDGENTPTVTAKGMGDIAEKIIEFAKQHNIPIEKDNGLVEFLAQLKLNAEIPETLYVAVAEVIAFSYLISGKWPKDYEK